MLGRAAQTACGKRGPTNALRTAAGTGSLNVDPPTGQLPKAGVTAVPSHLQIGIGAPQTVAPSDLGWALEPVGAPAELVAAQRVQAEDGADRAVTSSRLQNFSRKRKPPSRVWVAVSGRS